MHYLSNNELYYEIIVSKAKGKLTRKAEKMLALLAERTIEKFSYTNDEDKFDCYQSGVLDLFDNWYNFNEDKGRNSFAYYTEVFKRGVAKGLNKLYKKKGAKDEDIQVFSLSSMNEGKGMHNI